MTTVGILGSILIIANLGGTISFFVLYGDIDEMKNNLNLEVDFTFWDLLWINYIALTFNSCFNPAVYLVRTKALREYAVRGFRRVFRLKNNEVKNISGGSGDVKGNQIMVNTVTTTTPESPKVEV